MIEIKNVTKFYGRKKAVDKVSFEIQDGAVFGLLGTNGAGKSTLLRVMAGILKPEQGDVLIDGESVYENPEVKKNFFYISDNQFFFPNSTPKEMEEYYMTIYPEFDKERFEDFLVKFHLGKGSKINSYSKGMKRQLSILLAICSNTKYIYFDETFDGLDPVMRQAVKSLIAGEIEERGLTPIIAAHNLRELEDLCDYVGLLHRGGVILSKNLETMKCSIHKIQCVIPAEFEESVMSQLKPLQTDKRGSLLTFTVKCDVEKIEEVMSKSNPIFYEILPLSLEEIFISETEVAGYDIKKLIF